MDQQALARRVLGLRRWQVVGSVPPEPVIVMVAAPHTSNWDFTLMLELARALGVQPRFLMKRESFRGPADGVLRRLGGVPVDRDAAAGLVDDLVAHARGADRLALVLAPEGTRRKTDHWKSGFYRIAQQAEIPLVLCFIDKPTRTMGCGPTLRPSGDVKADMDVIREFYADKHGIVPANRTEPRLREEG